MLLVAVVVVVEGRAAGLVTGEDVGASPGEGPLGSLVRYHEGGHDKTIDYISSDGRHVVEGVGDSTDAPAAAIARLHALVIPGVGGDARHLRLLYEALEARGVATGRGTNALHGGTDGVQSGDAESLLPTHAGAGDEEEADIVWAFEPGDPRLLPQARGGGGGGGGHVDSPSPSPSIPAEGTDTSCSGRGRRRMRRTRVFNYITGRASQSFPFVSTLVPFPAQHQPSRVTAVVCLLKPLKYPMDTKDARR